jgi:hypothetical protein
MAWYELNAAGAREPDVPMAREPDQLRVRTQLNPTNPLPDGRGSDATRLCQDVSCESYPLTEMGAVNHPSNPTPRVGR